MTRHALIASYYVPQTGLDSSSRRLLHIIDFLRDDGWHVTVLAKNLAGSERGGYVLRQRGIPVYPYRKQAIEDLVAAQRFDMALLAFWHIAEPLVNTLRRLSPQTRIIVDSMDVHFVRHARKSFNADSGQSLDAAYGDEMVREVNVYASADAVLTVSLKEASLINDLVGDDGLAHLVPDCEELDQSRIPFHNRRGALFVGNFEHPPNADAVRFLCQSVVPLLDPQVLAEHPIYIVGRDLGQVVREFGSGLNNVHMVGWVPALSPYLEGARISVVPLRYGAGTKRKLIQTLMVGTPAVSTSVGLEGLGLEHDKHVLVADEPALFAASMERLLGDEPLWTDVARSGREHVLGTHNRVVARTAFFEVLRLAYQRPPKARALTGGRSQLPESSRRYLERDAYEGLVRRIKRVMRQKLPPESNILVVSRGDPALVDFEGSRAWHFPRAADGAYAGFHPANSAVAIEHLEQLRQEGADFIVFPSTSMWWLGHYRELSDLLFSRFGLAYRNEDTGIIFDLREERGAAPADRKSHAPADTVDVVSRNAALHSNGRAPRISVVIPTHNRASLLGSSLDSLANQSLDVSEFEVIVVDDGSTDSTLDVCNTHGSRLQLTYKRVEHIGIAAAKNAGTFAATGSVVLFFDDDDIADRHLLAEHLHAHSENPDELVAVLGYTDWAQSLVISEVMDFVTNVGQYLFSYRRLEDGQRLDFTYFWGGRASCKRSLFAKYGVYRPEFEFGSEDIELAYRMSRYGFHVRYRRAAIQHMNRPLTFAEFCQRCERQGQSLALFSRMHPEPMVQRYCLVDEATEKWPSLQPGLSEDVRRVEELQLELRANGANKSALLEELRTLYWRSFDAYKLKGVARGLQRAEDAAGTTHEGLEALHG